MVDTRPYLSKSTVLAGRQCPLRLWLGCFAPELAGPPDAAVEAIRADGADITLQARALFLGGVLVDEADFDRALARTRVLLDDPSVPALFEAAFVYDGVRIRADALERIGGGRWGLREVKAAARVKDVYLDDVALQRYVLEGSGLEIPSVEVIHVDAGYVRGDDVDWRRFFKRADVAALVAERMPHVPQAVRALREHLASPAPPVVEPSAHCWTPYRCEFWERCTRDKPADWIYHLPRIREAMRETFRAAGVERITDIPDDVELPALAARIRSVLQSGRSFVSPDLTAALAPFGPPALYLDFETMGPAIPVYPGTRPYERVPSQWSLHRLDADGVLTHREFLAGGRVDPRREFAETLLAAVAESADPIVVYSSFESDVLTDLALLFPDLERALESVRVRLRDLWRVIQAHVYDAGFRYSFSLKSVAPALVPGFGYGDLTGIDGGREASRAFARLARGRCGADEEATLRRALLAYCKRDTEALIATHRALSVVASNG